MEKNFSQDVEKFYKFVSAIILLIFIAYFCFSSITILNIQEQAVVLRWGKYNKLLKGQRVNFILPFGMEQTIRLKLAESLMVNGVGIIYYRILGPYNYLFKYKDIRKVIFLKTQGVFAKNKKERVDKIIQILNEEFVSLSLGIRVDNIETIKN